MAGQTAVSSMEPGFPGLLGDARRKHIATRVNGEASAEMRYGIMVKEGPTKDGALLMSATFVALVIDDVTFTAEADDDLLTFGAPHTLQTGDGPVRVANSGGALPTGLAAATDYWVIWAPGTLATKLKLASSLANALAGTAINITADGTGTQTLSDTAGTERSSPNRLAGITCHSHAMAKPEELGDTGVKPDMMVGCLQVGVVWVLVEGTLPTRTSGVHVRAEAAGAEVAGAFRATADGSDTIDISEFAWWTGRTGTARAELNIKMTNVAIADVQA